MGQSKDPKMSQSCTSLDALCDEAELRMVNMQFCNPANAPRYGCRDLCCGEATTISTMAATTACLSSCTPFHSEQSTSTDSDSERSTTSTPSESIRNCKSCPVSFLCSPPQVLHECVLLFCSCPICVTTLWSSGCLALRTLKRMTLKLQRRIAANSLAYFS